MDSGPFNRRSWVTQSLRVTAKELSLSGRGRHNAIAERFSKYQKAAEESSAERKKASDSVGPSVRSANLSVLKQRWEQPSAPAPAQPVPRCRPPAATRPIALLQGGQLATRPDGWPPAGGQASQGRGAMDSDDLRQKERPEMPEEQVPSSPRGFYAKPRVPLNNLKMKFERGEGAPSKAGRTTLRSSSSDDADQHGGAAVFDRVLESTSTKDKMAKYQAAVVKQSGAQPDVAPEALALRSSASADQGGTPAPQCNGENSEQAAALRKLCPPAREECIACLKTVYPLERLVALQHVYHKSCFRCLHCKMTLSLGNYASLHGNIYCKPHFNQLFKTKGNYEEGFGLRPHKELWEPRTDRAEGEASAKLRDGEEGAAVTRPAQGSSEEPPPEEESSPVKVTDLTALLESRAKTQAGASLQSRERAMEARRLRVAWPPPAAEEQAGTTALSPTTEATAPGRPFKAKWPPEGEGMPVHQSSDRAELRNLRRSSSLKERSRPFTIAAKPSPAPSLAPRERRPLKSLLEWRAMLEEKTTREAPPKEQEPSRIATKRTETPPRCLEEAATDDVKVSEEGSLRSLSDISPSPSPPLQSKQSLASQDVGFWEGDKEGSDAEELSAEDIIKRNRYYEDEDSDS